jgi:hypothetical protein
MPNLSVLDEYREGTPETSALDIGSLSQYKSELRPGEDWTKPIDDEHPELGVWQRFKLKSLADTGPATLQLNLEKEGFEAKHRGGMSFSIRKPGEKSWYVVDPSGFEPMDDVLEFLGSIAPSAAGMIAATGKGAAAGTALGGPAGGVAGGILASGGGAAAGEAAKMGLGKLMGIEYAPEEVGKKIALEGAFGAGGQAVAPVIGKLAGAGKRALMGEGKEVAMRNLAKQQAYKKAVAATPEGAPMPAAPVMEKVTQEGLIPAAGRKFQEARGAKALLEAPERKAREEFAGGAKELIERSFKDIEEVSLQELSRKSRQLKQNITKAAAKGKPTETLQKRLKVVDDARNVEKALRKATKAGKGVAPTTAALSKDSFIRQTAEGAGISTFGKSQEMVMKVLDDLITDERYAKYLNTGQDSAVRDAMDQQIKGIIGSLDPEEEFFVKFARRGPKKKEVDLPPEERFFREMEATRDMPFDAPAYRQAAKDLEGKTLDEMREVLDRAGWAGEVPSELDEITEALYRARTEGITGKGMSYDPQAYGLGGPPLEKGVGTVYEAASKGTPKGPRKTFGRAQVTELEAGGKKIPIGRELAQQQVEQMNPIQRAIAQPPGIARAAGRGLERLRTGTSRALRLRTGTSRALGAAAAPVGLPGEAIGAVGTKLSHLAGGLVGGGGKEGGATALGGLGLGTALYASGLAGAAGTAIGVGIVSKLAAGGLRKMSSAIMADPATLVAFMKKATGPVAAKMQVPLQALQNRGQSAYKAAVFSLLHDPEVRGFLQDLEKKD